MKTLFIFAYFFGLALASPITRFQEWKDDLNTDNNDHREKTAYAQRKLHGTGTPKMDPTIQPSSNYTIAGIKVKKDDSGITNQTSSIEIRCPILKYQRRRDLSHLTQKVPKKRTNGKKHRLNKVNESHNAHNTSRKTQVNDMFKHKLEKGSIMKQLQKRSIDYEDTPSNPYHSPDISYDWDAQENFNKIDDSQELNEVAGLAKSTDDLSSKTINENSDPIDSSESDHISTSESSSPRGSSESSSPVDPNESNSSNESSYSTESKESNSDADNTPVVLNEANQESSETDVQSSDFTTSASETTNGLSHESSNSDGSSQSNEHNESSSSSDSSSNESNNSNDSSSNESSNSSDSKISSHSTESVTHSDKSTENSSLFTEDTMNTDDVEENKIDS